jgi:hypothetical protein
MATLLHPLAALVFCNFRFASFFERAHSGFPDLRAGFNHLMRDVATLFFGGNDWLAVWRFRVVASKRERNLYFLHGAWNELPLCERG